MPLAPWAHWLVCVWGGVGVCVVCVFVYVCDVFVCVFVGVCVVCVCVFVYVCDVFVCVFVCV